MVSADDFYTAFVTVPDMDTAEKLAEKLVNEKLAACVNIVPGIRSIYRWKGKIEKDDELLLIIKTVKENSRKIIEFINRKHPYDVPECIFLRIETGNTEYLKWIAESTLLSENKGG